MTAPRLVLASASARRRELLDGLGVAFEVRPADVDESVLPGEDPRAYVLRLAETKAKAVAAPGTLVLAADTTVVLEGEILGKPADDAEATSMLRRLAGRRHQVLTGVAISHLDADRLLSTVDSTAVRFAPLSDEEIAWYVATGEPRDKAGAYAVQGRGALFVAALDGSWSNVVGLPIQAVYRLLKAAGLDLLSHARPTAEPTTPRT